MYLKSPGFEGSCSKKRFNVIKLNKGCECSTKLIFSNLNLPAKQNRFGRPSITYAKPLAESLIICDREGICEHQNYMAFKFMAINRKD